MRSRSAYLYFLLSRVINADCVCKDGAVFAPKVLCAVEQSNCVILCFVSSVPDVRVIVGRTHAGWRIAFPSLSNCQSIM